MSIFTDEELVEDSRCLSERALQALERLWFFNEETLREF